MDYKSVVEDQIRELQKVQSSLPKTSIHAAASCEVAKTILLLCKEASVMRQ